jgi:hypothetical protein
MPIQKITSGIIQDGAVAAADIVSVNGSVITANTIANSAIQTGAVENYMNAAGLGFGMRNRIINGAMVIDQRNAGASVTPLSGSFVTDRFSYGASQVSKFTAQQVSTAPSGFINSLKMTVASAVTVGASDFFYIAQAIEGLNISDLAWGTASASTVTLSFNVYSSLTGTFGGALTNGGANRSYPFSYTISAANTWEQKNITIAGDTSGTWLTTNGIGILLRLGLGVGSTYSGTAGAWAGSNLVSATGATSVVGTSGATFYITGVQLEKGSTATSFDYRTYTNELQLCQRYFYRVTGATGGYSTFGAGQAMSTTQGRISVHYPVTMRATPTITYTGTVYLTDSGANGVTVTSILAQYGSESGGMLAVGVASGLTAGNATLFMTAASSGNTIQASIEL